VPAQELLPVRPDDVSQVAQHVRAHAVAVHQRLRLGAREGAQVEVEPAQPRLPAPQVAGGEEGEHVLGRHGGVRDCAVAVYAQAAEAAVAAAAGVAGTATVNAAPVRLF
jgi:hypothetical protein